MIFERRKIDSWLLKMAINLNLSQKYYANKTEKINLYIYD